MGGERHPPPASQYPHLADGTLVPPTKAAVGFPNIPGVSFKDDFENPLIDYDWGPNFNYDDVSGVVSNVPPSIKRVIPLLVPKVDADGNEIAGVASVLHQAPLGTYLGWNVIPSGFFKGQMCAFTGAFIPFAKTKDERLAAKDPRPSLEERYSNQDGYVAAVRTAAQKAVQDRFLLPEDADLPRTTSRCEAAWCYRRYGPLRSPELATCASMKGDLGHSPV